MEQPAAQRAQLLEVLRHLTLAHRPASQLYTAYAQAFGEEHAAVQQFGAMLDHIQTDMVSVAEFLQHGEEAFDA